ncbi:hypothetical protein HZS_7613 [Henneguya salminicola]|nr:hypothetical protein HZS_7613 [Henneguya salminicola]
MTELNLIPSMLAVDFLSFFTIRHKIIERNQLVSNKRVKNSNNLRHSTNIYTLMKLNSESRIIQKV